MLVFTKGQSFLFIYFILGGSQTFPQVLAVYGVNDPFLFPTNSKRLRQNVLLILFSYAYVPQFILAIVLKVFEASETLRMLQL